LTPNSRERGPRLELGRCGVLLWDRIKNSRLKGHVGKMLNEKKLGGLELNSLEKNIK
jgi:hypothetical protein